VIAYAQEVKSATDIGPQTFDTRIGKLTFTHDLANGYPHQGNRRKAV
jgi:hypothetical protein